jgi:hypothetical protein
MTELYGSWEVSFGYDTVWKGKEKAMTELYGSWEVSFETNAK